MILDDERATEKALVTLATGKCRNLDITNHKTAYFALRDIKPPHKDNLKRMGYGCDSTNNNRTTSGSKSSMKAMERKVFFL